ncbi:MAG: hypothetical protein ACKO7Z_11080 [Cyanobacteriota bacterium]
MDSAGVTELVSREVPLAAPAAVPATVALLPQLLSWTAIGLLVFVSGGVIYLSTVEWRDRRRRQAADPSRRP